MDGRSELPLGRGTGSTRPLPFVGRESELDRVRRLLADGPVLVAIGGEPGMGKSRLMDEALAAMAPGELLVASCSPFPEPYTLAPIVDALSRRLPAGEHVELSQLGGALRPLFPEWADWLPTTPEPSGSAATDRHRLLRATAELLDTLGVHVLALDDAHLADGATIELVQLLFSRAGGAAISVVMTHRTQEAAPDAALHRLAPQLPSPTRYTSLTLEPLSEDETARLIADLVGTSGVSPVAAAFVQKRTGGLPLAVIELVRYLDEQGGPSLGAAMEDLARRSPDAIPLPPTLAASVLDRLDRLPETARVCVRAAAIMGEPVAEPGLSQVAGLALDEARVGIADAMERGLLHEHADHRISVAHPIMSQVVYDATPAPTRRALHERAARLLRDSDSSPTSLVRAARHLRRAGLLDEWRELAPLAAERARAASDEATASTIDFEIMTNGRSTPGEVLNCARRISFAHIVRPEHYSSIVDALQASLAKSVSNSTRGALLFQLGRVFSIMTETAAARRAFEDALPNLWESPTDHARTLIQLARLNLSEQPIAVRTRLLEDAEKSARLVPPADAPALAVDRASVLRELGDERGWRLDVATFAGEQPWSRKAREEVAREYMNRAWSGITWGLYSISHVELEHAREITRGDMSQISDGIAETQQMLDWATGVWDGLSRRVSVLVDASETSPSQRISANLTRALLTAATVYEGDDVPRGLVRVAEESRARSEVQPLIIALGALARIAADVGRPGDALPFSTEVVDPLAAGRIWLGLADVGSTHVAALCDTGSIVEAEKLVERWSAGARGLDAPSVRITLLSAQAHVLGARGELKRASALFQQAAAAWAQLPRPLEAHRSTLEAGAALISAGASEKGHGLVTTALRALLNLGASGEARRLYGSLVRRGITPRTHPYRSGRRGYGAQLSPSELDVVRLVATGRNNREIAQALSRSPKTVYSQLRSAMTKLHAETRVDLALKVINAGLASPP